MKYLGAILILAVVMLVLGGTYPIVLFVVEGVGHWSSVFFGVSMYVCAVLVGYVSEQVSLN